MSAFTLIQGGDEQPAWTDVVPDETRRYVCNTFGELFADFAYQLRRGEYSNLMHRLNACAEEYGSILLPVKPEEQEQERTTLGSVFELPTERQWEVLELLGQGFRQMQIAEKLWLAYDTVRSHTRRLRAYFDAHSNRELVTIARAWGFIEPEGSELGSGALRRWAS